MGSRNREPRKGRGVVPGRSPAGVSKPGMLQGPVLGEGTRAYAATIEPRPHVSIESVRAEARSSMPRLRLFAEWVDGGSKHYCVIRVMAGDRHAAWVLGTTSRSGACGGLYEVICASLDQALGAWRRWPDRAGSRFGDKS